MSDSRFDTIPLLTETLIASGAVTARRFVTIAGAMCGAGGAVFGVSQSDAASGEAFAADVAGRLAVEAGAAINRGARVKSDAQGRAVPAANNEAAYGVAIAAAAGAGYPARILLFFQTPAATA